MWGRVRREIEGIGGDLDVCNDRQCESTYKASQRNWGHRRSSRIAVLEAMGVMSSIWNAVTESPTASSFEEIQA